MLSPVSLSSASPVLGAVLGTPPCPPQGLRASCSQPRGASGTVQLVGEEVEEATDQFPLGECVPSNGV